MSTLHSAPGSPLIGTRMSAQRFLALPDDGARYELTHGAVTLSLSPVPRHQQPLAEVIRQLSNYLEENPVGFCYPDMDVCFGRDDDGEDVVFRPDLVFVGNSTSAQIEKRIVGVPDMVLEVVSPDYRQHDTQTKRVAYERFGVSEYWLIDPERDSLTFLRLLDGKYQEIAIQAEAHRSQVIPGFCLSIGPVRRKFRNWRPG